MSLVLVRAGLRLGSSVCLFHQLCLHLGWEIPSCLVPCVLLHRPMLAEVVFMTLDLLGVDLMLLLFLVSVGAFTHSPSPCFWLLLALMSAVDQPCLSLSLCSEKCFCAHHAIWLKETAGGFAGVHSSHPRQGQATDGSLQNPLVAESWWCSCPSPHPTLAPVFAHRVYKKDFHSCFGFVKLYAHTIHQLFLRADWLEGCPRMMRWGGGLPDGIVHQTISHNYMRP